MRRAMVAISPPDGRLAQPSAVVTLTRESRYRRRVAMTTDCGVPFLLDLPEAMALSHGDGLVLEDGTIVLVQAAKEPLMQITASTPVALARIAWHIGNRHCPAEMASEAIYIEPDHVLADMVRRLGGNVTEVSRAFAPEGGAYDGPAGLDAAHGHGAHHHHEH